MPRFTLPCATPRPPGHRGPGGCGQPTTAGAPPGYPPDPGAPGTAGGGGAGPGGPGGPGAEGPGGGVPGGGWWLGWSPGVWGWPGVSVRPLELVPAERVAQTALVLEAGGGRGGGAGGRG